MYSSAKIKTDRVRKVPSRIYDFDEPALKGTPEQIAQSFLKKITPDLQIRPDLSQVKFEQVKKSLTGSHVLYQQYFYGQPVTGAWIRVDIDKEGRVFNIMNDLLPETMLKERPVNMLDPKVHRDDLNKLASDCLMDTDGTLGELIKPELVYYRKGRRVSNAWKLLIKEQRCCNQWKVYLDAHSGKVLARVNLLKHVTGSGRVFDPNPIASLNDAMLTNASTIADSAYVDVDLKDLDKTGNLDGPFISTGITLDRAMNADFKFFFDRGDPHFKEVMAYYHIDSIQRYIQELGFENMMNQQLQVNVNGSELDNSIYSPIDKTITFGNGGVDDAEDAEVIIHEYGHAILDFMVPGFGETSDQARAIGEGFCDYLAASFFAEKKPGFLRPTFGNWNAAAMNGGANPPCMRRLDVAKRFPFDFKRNAHSDGEIWSGCLWAIREKLGGQTADRLILEHLSFLTKDIKFEMAAGYMITVDEQLNGGANTATIHQAFKDRNLVL